MKRKIVQAVKLGTVACLLAVTTQTIGERDSETTMAMGENSDTKEHILEGMAGGSIRGYNGSCILENSKHYKKTETGRNKFGEKFTYSISGHCKTYIGKEKEEWLAGRRASKNGAVVIQPWGTVYGGEERRGVEKERRELSAPNYK
jgi:hypothetical protein